MNVLQIDPVQDPRWTEFLDRHPRASVFHSPGWLEALRSTYGYEPFALTTAAKGQDLNNGLVFCQVKSWLTGRRTISLPFSDHCEPLVETGEDFHRLTQHAASDQVSGGAKYLEIRPLTLPRGSSTDLAKSDSFCLHQLDLRPNLDEIFDGFHRNCVQRKLRRAHREALGYEEGNSESLLAKFYSLLVLTRRRHQLAPQPIAWFRNLIACLGDSLKIRVASKNGEPVASILTLRYKETMVYKYGCSDKRFSNLGGMHLLLWKAIEEAKKDGLTSLDLGRSDWDNPGLLAFKDRWGAARSNLDYRLYGAASSQRPIPDWQIRTAKSIFGHLPNALLPLAGSLVYRHLHRSRA